ncbi:hypothetical protein LQV63_16965 [Paenibacillus profundus]|uniref:Uncharacterized protein n=1 Tax=Paenibacillus profundus TaxID=1173085 RepID=A0ABS8YN19_9BACL|nr:hypothetical protein [Paenibacillus profundus]
MASQKAGETISPACVVSFFVYCARNDDQKNEPKQGTWFRAIGGCGGTYVIRYTVYYAIG